MLQIFQVFSMKCNATKQLFLANMAGFKALIELDVDEKGRSKNDRSTLTNFQTYFTLVSTFRLLSRFYTTKYFDCNNYCQIEVLWQQIGKILYLF
jgi:hypothetical protein